MPKIGSRPPTMPKINPTKPAPKPAKPAAPATPSKPGTGWGPKPGTGTRKPVE